MNASEDRVVQAILVKYKHPLSAVRHLLSFYSDLPAPTLTRMTRAILQQHPANLSGSIDPENHTAFVREAQKRGISGRTLSENHPPRRRSKSRSRSKPAATAPTAPTAPAKTVTEGPKNGSFLRTLFD